MGCDEPRLHRGQMLDASLLVLVNHERSRAFVREWLAACTQSRILTDEPNVCGLANLPGFLDHRHDQSVLSLLATRDGMEIFRHPSQNGNHAKDESVRQPGEWTRHRYGYGGIFHNSPYPTLLNHHKNRPGFRPQPRSTREPGLIEAVVRSAVERVLDLARRC